MQLQLPKDKYYWPQINVRVHDSQFGGVYTPMIGYASIPLSSKPPEVDEPPPEETVVLPENIIRRRTSVTPAADAAVPENIPKFGRGRLLHLGAKAVARQVGAATKGAQYVEAAIARNARFGYDHGMRALRNPVAPIRAMIGKVSIRAMIGKGKRPHEANVTGPKEELSKKEIADQTDRLIRMTEFFDDADFMAVETAKVTQEARTKAEDKITEKGARKEKLVQMTKFFRVEEFMPGNASGDTKKSNKKNKDNQPAGTHTDSAKAKQSAIDEGRMAMLWLQKQAEKQQITERQSEEQQSKTLWERLPFNVLDPPDKNNTEEKQSAETLTSYAGAVAAGAFAAVTWTSTATSVKKNRDTLEPGMILVEIEDRAEALRAQLDRLEVEDSEATEGSLAERDLTKKVDSLTKKVNELKDNEQVARKLMAMQRWWLHEERDRFSAKV